MKAALIALALLVSSTVLHAGAASAAGPEVLEVRFSFRYSGLRVEGVQDATGAATMSVTQEFTGRTAQGEPDTFAVDRHNGHIEFEALVGFSSVPCGTICPIVIYVFDVSIQAVGSAQEVVTETPDGVVIARTRPARVTGNKGAFCCQLDPRDVEDATITTRVLR